MKNHLINCIGIFQGGGCKAISFIGAYRAALEKGIGFSEFGGTSAGAIIAAFLAAGATPEDLIRFVSETNFSIFKLPNKSSWYLKLLHWFIWKLYNIPYNYLVYFHSALNKKGISDSISSKDCVSRFLKQLMHTNKDITFADLKFPLTIVASDIIDKKLKVWNLETTPTVSVAYAVQCSCALPIVYTPVDNRYVDGGLLCNLPTIVFPNISYEFDRILAFTFSPNNEKGKDNPLIRLIKDVIDTVIEGTTDIQKKFKENVSFVAINTSIGLMDFDKINPHTIKAILKTGESAMNTFYKNEKRRLLNNNTNSSNGMARKESVRALVFQYSCKKNDRVIVSLPSLSWTWDMFLTILRWKNDKCKIEIYTNHIEKYKDNRFKAQLRALIHMGIDVYVLYDPLPLYGYFFEQTSTWTGLIVRLDEKEKLLSAQRFESEIDSDLLKIGIQKLKDSNYKHLKGIPIEQIKMIPVDESEILNRLQNLPMYKSCPMAFEEVEVSKVLFMTKYVLGYKYRPMEIMLQMYDKDMQYGAAGFIFAQNKISYIGPPVIEEKNEEFVIINGNTRFYHAYKNGIKKIKAVVIRNVALDLISTARFTIDEIVVTDKTKKAKTRYDEKWNANLFRPIESAIRPHDTYLLNN